MSHETEYTSIETLSLHCGYDYHKGENSMKAPIYQTSTFKFDCCADGEAFFKGERSGYIYSRIGTPNTVLYEKRLSTVTGNEAGIVFSSGMSAVTATFFGLCKPGDGMVGFFPLYGGTTEAFESLCPSYGIKSEGFDIHDNCVEELKAHLMDTKSKVNKDNVKIIYCETPTNPSMQFVDIAACCAIRDEVNKNRTKENRCVVVVDNTFMGPVFSNPKDFGADVTLYSCTKFLGGHSDLVAGAVCGPADIIAKIRGMRSMFGSTASPMTCFLLCRSLETVVIRMKAESQNCEYLYHVLDKYQKEHPDVIEKILYPLALDPKSNQFEIYKKQCKEPGSMITFNLKDKRSAYLFCDSLKLIPIAVSLGASESLCQVPFYMTHAKVPAEIKQKSGIVPGMIRLSVGLEDKKDLEHDILNALKVVEKAQQTGVFPSATCEKQCGK